MQAPSPSEAISPDYVQKRLALCGFSAMFAMRICDALLPALASEFKVDSVAVAPVISAFAVGYGIMQMLYGPFAERFGKLPLVFFATVGGAGACLWAALASGLDMLIWARLVCGGLVAGIVPMSMAWIGDHSSEQQRHLMLARLLSATVLGMIVGQFFGGIVAVTVGWRWGFALLCLLFAGAALWLLPLLRAVQYKEKTKQLSFWRNWRNVLKRPMARMVLLLVGIEGALVYGVLSFVPLYLHTQTNLSLPVAGAIVTSFGIGGLCYTRTVKYLLQRWGRNGLIFYGGCGVMVGYLLLAVWPVPLVAILGCWFAGFGFYALHNSFQFLASQMAPAMRGTAIGLFACSLFLGQSVGVSMVAWSIDRLQSAQLALGVSAICVVLLGSWLVYWLKCLAPVRVRT
ncbi:MAG: MFS transporter [Paenalcaligenes sp.]